MPDIAVMDLVRTIIEGSCGRPFPVPAWCRTTWPEDLQTSNSNDVFLGPGGLQPHNWFDATSAAGNALWWSVFEPYVPKGHPAAGGRSHMVAVGSTLAQGAYLPSCANGASAQCDGADAI